MKFLTLLLIALHFNAFAQTVKDGYRVGDDWGKKVVTQSDFNSSSVHFQKLALSMLKINGATGVYLGKFAGKHLAATNHHVCPAAFACVGSYAEFYFGNKKIKIVDIVGSWEQIELTIFVLDNRYDSALAGLGVNFAFDEELVRGQKLLSMGYGGNHNPEKKLTATQDSDCVVFSQGFRRLPDHDDPRRENYRAWSFAHGCDASLGDSGSPMMDRETGKLLGLLWSGQNPKKPEIQTSVYLNNLLKFPTNEIWTELSYAVPAYKMKDFLVDEIISGAFSQQKETVLRALLEQ